MKQVNTRNYEKLKFYSVSEGIEEALRRIREAQKHDCDELDLSGLNLREIPKEVIELKPLKQLYLGLSRALRDINYNMLSYSEKLLCNTISEIPNALIAAHPTLEVLDISSNRISSLPDLALLTHLKTLDLRDNLFRTQIQDVVSRCSQSLKILNLHRNNIGTESVQMIAYNLINLNELYLNDNSIRTEGAQAIAQNLKNLKILALSDNTIGTKGAQAIAYNLKDLNELYLNDNNIGTKGAEVIAQNLKNLKTLALGDNSIETEGAEAIAQNLRDLKILSLSDNAIGTEGTKAIAQNLKDLDELYLSNSNIGTRGAEVIAQNLKNLKTLALDDNTIGTEGAEAIGQNLKDVKILSLSNNSIGTEGAQAIAQNIKGLKKLWLQDSFIGTEGAEAIAQNLKDLEILVLSNNIIGTEGTQAIAQNLKNLKTLALSVNNIGTEGAEAIAHNLKDLNELYLNDNNIGTKGAEVITQNLKNLKTLALGNNIIGIEGAKAVAQNLKNLKILDLNDNNIGTEGTKAIAHNLKDLNRLYLYNNGTGTEGAEAIAHNLKDLKILVLNNSNIGTEGARAIAQNLKNLNELYLSTNNIRTEGAQAIAENLKDLKTLVLSNNNIGTEGAKAIAANAMQLISLSRLEIANNNISSAGFAALLDAWLDVPHSDVIRTIELKTFWELDSESDLPEELLETTDAQTLLRRWADYRTAEKEKRLAPLLEAKILVIGREAVGKTTLCDLLINNKSRDHNKRNPTAGVDLWPLIDTYNFDLDEMGITEKGFRLRIWDFGGQDMLQGPHRLFFTRRSLYLLVLDDTKIDDTSYFDLLSVIALRGDNSPVIIVINKSDNADKTGFNINDKELKKLKKKYPNIVGRVRMSCDGDVSRTPTERSKRLRQELLSLIGDVLEGRNLRPIPQNAKVGSKPLPWLPHLRDQVDRAWLKIRDKLVYLAEEKSVLPDTEFRRLCIQVPDEGEQIENQDIQNDMLSLFNDLGIIVAMGLNSEGLGKRVEKEIRLLDPNWLIHAMYTIIWNTRQADTDGEFTEEMVLNWLCETSTPKIIVGTEAYHQYQQHHIEFILEMMCSKNVELAFKLDDSATYVCPDALTASAPDFDEPNSSDCIRFRYAYTNRHPGIMPRFIVRTHHLAGPNPTRWKGGVTLRIENCMARIWQRDRVTQGARKLVEIVITGQQDQCKIALGRVRDALEFIHERFYPEAQAKAYVPFPRHLDDEIEYAHLIEFEQDAEFDNDKLRQLPGWPGKYSINELLEGVRWEPHKRSALDDGFGWDLDSKQPFTIQNIYMSHSSKTVIESEEKPKPLQESKKEKLQSKWLSPNLWFILSCVFGLLGSIISYLLNFFQIEDQNQGVAVSIAVGCLITFIALLFNPQHIYRRLAVAWISIATTPYWATSLAEQILQKYFPLLRDISLHWTVGNEEKVIWLIVLMLLIYADLKLNTRST